jgi:hypothetical protein
MIKKVVIQKYLTVMSLTMILVSLATGSESEGQSVVKFHSLRLSPGFDKMRANAVGKAVAFEDWPQTEARRVAPMIDKSLTSNPNLITRESIAYTYVHFDDQPWGKAMCSWDSLIEDGKPLPAELPPELKRKLLAEIPVERRKDATFVDRYLKRKLERYQKSQKYRLEGQMSIEVLLAPSCRAAQEYMLTRMTENTMPTDALAKLYATAERPENLGTVGFLTESRKKDDVHVRFARDNVCLNIWANGCLAEEALPLARKIDAMIPKQPTFTYPQLTAQRPSVMIDVELEDKRMVSYDASAPAGQEIVRVEAFIDGQNVVAKDGKIHLADKRGTIKVNLIAITRQLLANSFERDLIIDK